jgi:hypothetical protein
MCCARGRVGASLRILRGMVAEAGLRIILQQRQAPARRRTAMAARQINAGTVREGGWGRVIAA